MSEWRGLANPERHAPTSVTDMAWCNVCDGPCYSTEACCCCLAAEVKRLERAEAAIARVRDMCADKWREVEESDPLFGPPLTLTVPDVLRALEEADDE